MPHVNTVDVAPDGTARTVVDRHVLAKTTGYSPATIRKRLRPLRYDPDTGRALYDRDAAIEALRPNPDEPDRDPRGRFVTGTGARPRPERRGPRDTPRRNSA